jgi:hypothetical protein
VEANGSAAAAAVLDKVDGCPVRPLDGVRLSSVAPIFTGDPINPGTTAGSSNCPAGVNSSPPSGLNVSLLKKFVQLSSPYNLRLDHDNTAAEEEGEGRERIAGRAGMGDGERP